MERTSLICGYKVFEFFENINFTGCDFDYDFNMIYMMAMIMIRT